MGSRKAAAIREIMLTQDEIEYIGTLGACKLVGQGSSANSDGIHEKDSNHISLQQWFSVVFAGPR
jgi:hypothetical protein